MAAFHNRVGGALAHPVAGKFPFYRLFPAVGLCFLLLSGCAGYRLGSGAAQKFTTLFIAPVTTETLIPQARELVTTQLREAFIRDGRVTLVNSPAQADAVLQLSLIGYDRTVVVSRQDDTGLARRLDVTLRAQATLTDQRSKQAFFAQRPLSARRGVFTDSGLGPAEYQGLSLLAEQLAAETAHAVLDTW